MECSVKILLLLLFCSLIGCSRYTLISSKQYKDGNAGCWQENWWIDEHSALKEPVKRVVEVPCQ